MPAAAFMSGIGFGAFRRDHCGGILHEIDAAPIAFSTMRLLVAARWALERKRHVTARAEVGAVRRVGRAFRAFHVFIIGRQCTDSWQKAGMRSRL